METARPAREDDVPACLALLELALTQARSVRGGPALVGTVTSAELLTRWMDAAPTDAVVYVGEFHHAVVGMAAAPSSAAGSSVVMSKSRHVASASAPR
jgi:hypothetical protein